MCRIMVDIQSATVEIRRRKKEGKKIEEETTGQKNIMSASATQGGHKNIAKPCVGPEDRIDQNDILHN